LTEKLCTVGIGSSSLNIAKRWRRRRLRSHEPTVHSPRRR
jgi:hypothetical protein